MKKLLEKWLKAKEKHSDRIVLVRASVFYIAFEEDAEKLHNIFGFELKNVKSMDGEHRFANFLHFKLEEMVDKAIANGERFCATDK